jgi:hypothetical protein
MLMAPRFIREETAYERVSELASAAAQQIGCRPRLNYGDCTTASAAADYVTLYQGDARTLAASLDRIHRTAAEIIMAIGPDV